MSMKEGCDRSAQRLERILKELVLHLAQQLSRAESRDLPKDEFARISAFGPLEMVTFLKQEFAALIAVRVQASADRNTQAVQAQIYERKVQSLETDLQTVTESEQELQSQVRLLQSQLHQSKTDFDLLASSTTQALGQTRTDNASLLDLLKAREATTEDVKVQLESLRQLVKTQEEELQRIPVLEEQVRELEKKYPADMTRAELKHKSELQKSEKELQAHKKVLAVTVQYEEKIKQLSLELESFRRKFRKQIDSQQRAIHLTEVASERNKTIQKLEIECNRYRVQLEARTQETTRLKKSLESAYKQIDEIREKPPEPNPEQVRADAIERVIASL